MANSYRAGFFGESEPCKCVLCVRYTYISTEPREWPPSPLPFPRNPFLISESGSFQMASQSKSSIKSHENTRQVCNKEHSLTQLIFGHDKVMKRQGKTKEQLEPVREQGGMTARHSVGSWMGSRNNQERTLMEKLVTSGWDWNLANGITTMFISWFWSLCYVYTRCLQLGAYWGRIYGNSTILQFSYKAESSLKFF